MQNHFRRLAQTMSHLRNRFKLRRFYTRMAAFQRHRTAYVATPPHARLVAAVVHLAEPGELVDAGSAAYRTARLAATIDGLLESFAHCQLEIVVVTQPGRHAIRFLPTYQQRDLRIVEDSAYEPMLLGFRAQDELLSRMENHDWFLYLEDDIQIRDARFVDKLAAFNALPGAVSSLLLPNRYEYVEGVKRYIDLSHCAEEIAWRDDTSLSSNGCVFAECSNPHAGMFALNQSQLQRLAASGRQWRSRDVYGGPRESAATFSLMECFRLYKPAASNLEYLEVKHRDSKYSALHAGIDAYSFRAVAASDTGVRR